ncbi:endonuclease III domain-containing protein [Campylobacter insulaenigrae]|uniref:Endonuclease III domain-containing protein n=1 Tax=Campylobacter insulaenigrae TaxID=260714 RepID=A0ABY3G3F1_9BACT|nr:endonuclease III domain-containing protein [Campylobacter insulaenigrae]MCR6570253.1 endonuclease III domain-containing protein [Campylobacter insulaenigrae]MCR6571655.1 endonuclease III domain-containing protein [Campylobacter insulaenigrae]MCR6573293.1 endonuclease III domain-containing protein [Campylobacter insulaenigrae]MCR6574758.1 endonuclease III domain-containing protein [Campylobacter insulaenigrae]MCR6576550.1 endonuclease III domain-containing protein [Campylobacter insulaenigra
MNGYEIFKVLILADIEFKEFEWFENNKLSEFEILISVILTQNTNWKNVLKALENLRSANITKFEDIQVISMQNFASLIKPSGFYNTKAKYIKNFIQALFDNFASFDEFKNEVCREWLLDIKGLGQESVDGILNYICKREVLVVDAYSAKISRYLGYELDNYEDLNEFFIQNIASNQNNLNKLLGRQYELYELYQIFHAMIVIFCKKYFLGKNISTQGEGILKSLTMV